MKVDYIHPGTDAPQGDPIGPVVMTIGSFDGVHLGHQFLIGGMVDRARERGIESLVVTFNPLPAVVLQPDAKPKELTNIDERLRLLQNLKVDRTGVISFTKEVSRQPARQFLEWLLRRYSPREIWAGEDFGFGYRRAGNVSLLEEIGKARDFDVRVLRRKTVSGQNVASRTIRKLITVGDVEAAARLLGHYPMVSGLVERGAGRGRGLGFPTANLSVEPVDLLPAPGIYAGYAYLSSGRYRAAISVGHNPTFGVNPLTVEAHLLDFDCDIWGDPLSLEFAIRLRDEAYFPSTEALVTQIGRDVEQAREELLRRDASLPQSELPAGSAQP